MSARKLQQAELRIYWAGEKIENLKSAIEHARQCALEAVSSQDDPNARDPYSVFRDNLRNEAIRLTSEFMLHARAALDYIIFALALNDSGSEQKGTQFPINKTPECFFKNRTTSLKHITPEHFAQIEEFQPYNRCPSLLLLHRLSNLDKHRELISIPIFGDTSMDIVPVGETNPRIGMREMQMNRRQPFHVLRDNGASVEKALADIHSQIVQIVNYFDGILR